MSNKNEQASNLGRIGGLARSKKLSQERRSEIARMGAIAKNAKYKRIKDQEEEEALRKLQGDKNVQTKS